MIKKTIFLILFLIFFTGCGGDLVTFLDEYNEPYDIKVIPLDNGIMVNYWSGVLASDFAGFNFYVNNSGNFTQPNDAITNVNGVLPTYAQSNHSRVFFSFQIPGTYNNGSLYYVAISAYGTNDLASNKIIETKISGIYPVVARPEGNGSVDIITDGNILNANSLQVAETATDTETLAKGIKSFGNYRMQYLGYQTNFNSVVIITNTNSSAFDNSVVPYQNNGMYLLYDSSVNTVVKLWITSLTSTKANFRWAVNNNANLWFGV